ncbi:TIGR04222 domain-containing membrane protein [Plantactinospora sp. KLBMP9567]|uniref:TIGR04222 domain-containing membrane protein n=1 Tax=Plantactinospora sp. KLBMP9567 TaxID=3085900 RepID=UPI0029816F20|nr:TIGR04222 domain-containing membrane protein [Plantactinospora sp. KLBMP9567]MDW5326295.1 TIGR04222 domain-containing membrane protein [Plantactinospora sp. KLBMP9567]
MTLLLWTAAVVFAGLVLLTRARVKTAVQHWLPEVRKRQWRPASTADPLADLGTYELAYLMGDAGHAIDAALVTLHHGGAVRISREGEVSAVTGVPVPTDPLERAVLDTLATDPHRPRSAPELRAALRFTPVLTSIHRRLEDLGMLTPDEAVEPTRARLVELLTASVGATVVPWLLLVAAAVFFPVDWLAALGAALLGTAAGGLGIREHVLGRRAIDTIGGHGGWHGDRFLVHRVAPEAASALLRKSDAARRGPAKRRALVPVGLAVALGGLAVLADPTLQTALRPPEPESESGGAGTGYGGCGGGCGGCG